ncbi:hypothetical protein SARC_01343 [Sphaeroforma arctica JP610]|uniref:Uncharacterized protein n=1 Tax=Sphaeroforma arctica JP610 TaxID=667725 RepID=A0A0L0GE27_9EUKA|nr:hypothetical protein SARC_01343 [Sphaeroforma arctica JP610]KNC86513.1 hypothetical protein SARC_01343 [Sphaeroforma arctica JP610]|eukprot:XP_014160415.1 hypothetical protein SARC_01343 [Sphaeroforma arctica JP610]
MKKETTVHGAQEIHDVYITEPRMIIHSQTGILPVVVPYAGRYPDDKELLPFDIEFIDSTATIKETGTGTKRVFTNETETVQDNILVEAVLSFCNGVNVVLALPQNGGDQQDQFIFEIARAEDVHPEYHDPLKPRFCKKKK